MYRIVDDDLPPIPDACSEEMRDFLMQCFKKNPANRPRAEMLFEHPWLKQTLGEARVSVPHLGRGCYLSERHGLMQSKQRALSQVLRPMDSIPFLHRVIARSDAAQSRSHVERVAPSSPRISESPRDGSGLRSLSLSPSPTSPSSEDFPPRAHSFVKTTFGKGSPFVFLASSVIPVDTFWQLSLAAFASSP